MMVHEVSFRFPVIPFQKFFQETSITSWPCPTWFLNLRLLWLSSPHPPVLLLPEEGTFSFSQIQQTPRPPLHHSVFTPLSFAFCWFNVLLRYLLFLHPPSFSPPWFPQFAFSPPWFPQLSFVSCCCSDLLSIETLSTFSVPGESSSCCRRRRQGCSSQLEDRASTESVRLMHPLYFLQKK